MKTLKKSMAWILTVTICLSLFSVCGTGVVTAGAASEVPVQNSVTGGDNNASLENSGITVKGTDSFGKMVGEAVDEMSQEQTESDGNNIFSVEMEGSKALAEFETTGNAVLTVAVFDEAGEAMLASGKAAVTPDDTRAEITVNINTMPEYFLLRAFLTDAENNLPLCASYESSVYTQEMQEFLSKEVSDFNEDLVLNLDDDDTNNFAVFDEKTIFIDQNDENVNVVTSVDDDNRIYVIENADDIFSSLNPGDVLSYQYDNDNQLIVKIESISVDGTTVTIHGSDIELEDVFDYVKIDDVSGSDKIQVDNEGRDDFVTYNGIIDDSQSNSQMPTNKTSSSVGAAADSKSTGLDIEGGLNMKCSFTLRPNDGGSKKFNGGIDIGFAAKMKLYITLRKQYFELKLDYSGNFNVGITVSDEAGGTSGSIDDENNDFKISLGKLYFYFAGDVLVETSPSFVGKISGSITLNATFKGSLGSRMSVQEGFKSLNSAPKWKFSIDVKGTVFIGLQMKAEANILKGLVKATLTTTLGGEAVAKLEKFNGQELESGDSGSVEHDCNSCVKGEIYAKYAMEAKVKFLNSKRLTIKGTLAEIKIKIFDFYVSDIDRGFTICPHKRYKYTFNVIDEFNIPVKQAGISCEYTEDDGANVSLSTATDDNGQASLIFPSGKYTVHVTSPDFDDKDYSFRVVDEPEIRTIKLSYNNAYTPASGSVVATGKKIIIRGYCGSQVLYTLYDDGELVISGNGEMRDFGTGWNENRPWYNYLEKIKTATIENGVTHIGIYSFDNCINLEKLIIPPSVHSMYSSFANCNNLKGIYISDLAAWCQMQIDSPLWGGNLEYYQSVTYSPLYYAKNLYLNGNLVTDIIVPDEVTKIGNVNFAGCTNLRSVTIGKNVSEIGYYAFSSCSNLTRIIVDDDNPYFDSRNNCNAIIHSNSNALISGCNSTVIPNSVEKIGLGAFAGSGILDLVIPDSVKTIDAYAFCSCSKLKNLIIPYGVQSIEKCTFCESKSLENISLPESIKYIDTHAFSSCEKLEQIYIPDSAEIKGEQIFRGCSNLKTAHLPQCLKSISDSFFLGCSKLEQIIIPDSVEKIGSYAFSECTSLKSIIIPDNVTTIDVGAFQICTSLESVKLSENLTQTSNGLFAACTSLESIELPKKLETITYYTFDGCTNLKSIFVPKSVKNVYHDAFRDCNSISDIYYEGSESEWNNVSIQYEGNYRFRNATVHFNCTGLPANSAELTAAKPENKAQAAPAPAVQKAEPVNKIIAEPESVGDSPEQNNTFTREYLAPGTEALLMILQGTPEDYSTENSALIYIAQTTVADDGKATFTVPQSLDQYYYVAVIFGACQHVTGDWIVLSEPTGDEDGVRIKVCERCGEVVETEAIPHNAYAKGDANRDGVIDVRDVTAIQRHLSDFEPIPEAYLTPADFDGDGAVTIADATAIQMFLAEFDIPYSTGS